MRIIDLDSPIPEKNPEPIQVVDAKFSVEKVSLPQNPVVKEIADPVANPKVAQDQKEKLLRKLEEEDRYVRYQRAMNHLKYFDQLGPDLLPIKGADFSEIYEEQKVYRDRLKSIWLKKQQLEKTGRLDQPRYLTDAELARIGALKHDRSNAYKNASKLKKKIEEAKIKGSLTRMAGYEKKLEELSLKIMELSHEIEKMVKNGLVS